jgi:predicted nucleic acid-binding protein
LIIQIRLVLDAGALIHVEGDPRGEVHRACGRAMEAGKPPLLPTVVLAQVWRASARQAPLAALRRACVAVPFTEDRAEKVGRLLAVSGTADVIDAAVLLTAIEHNAAVLTSDPQDMRQLADAANARVQVISI